MRNNGSKRRVVVTGLGVVSSIGIGWQEFWKNLLAGKSGITPVSWFDPKDYDRKFAGEVKDFDPAQFINREKLKFFGRASQMALAAGLMALKDAGFEIKDSVNHYDAGVCFGTTMGEPQIMEKFDEEFYANGSRVAELSSVAKYPSNNIAAVLSSEFGFKGPQKMFANACAAGNFALGQAFDFIQNAKNDVMLAGGSDAISRISYTGFHRLIAIASEKCQPFDKGRQGIIPGEGSGVLVLEEFEHAQKRGVSIYAEILGCGASSDAFHLTQPQSKGGIKAVQKALKSAGIEAENVDYINAHGTGTTENDRTECAVFKKVFGRQLKSIPVSSIKSMLGHTMGAASAIESIACCLAIKDQKIPPTINHETPDPECDIDCVPNKYREHSLKIALNNSLAFGGNNFSVIFMERP